MYRLVIVALSAWPPGVNKLCVCVCVPISKVKIVDDGYSSSNTRAYRNPLSLSFFLLYSLSLALVLALTLVLCSNLREEHCCKLHLTLADRDDPWTVRRVGDKGEAKECGMCIDDD